jgi:hypothetical protein
MTMTEQTQLKVTVPLRNFPASEQELSDHAEFIKKLKNPLWEAV